MVTVAAFFKPEEAHLARMRLEAAGIEAFLRDENFTQIWGFSVDSGGVKLEVADEDAEAALAVLETGE